MTARGTPDGAARERRPATDRFGREHVYLRLSVTDRCNLRCSYCRPARAVSPPGHTGLTDTEIERLVSIVARLGVRKVRITGGEPTVRGGIDELCARVRGVPGIDTLALTTNGVRLEALAERLFASGVRRVNVSIDSLRRDRYARLTGRDCLDQVLRGVARALDVGFVPLRINVVVVAGVNDDELLELVELARERPLEMRFIELMPTKGTDWRPARFLPCTAMFERIAQAHTLVPVGDAERTGGVAKDFAIAGFAGRVSFVAPFSDSFCGRCNRLRVTADGRLKTCLFAAPERDLRAALRRGDSDDAIELAIVAALAHKPERHPPLGALVRAAEPAMHEVGG